MTDAERELLIQYGLEPSVVVPNVWVRPRYDIAHHGVRSIKVYPERCDVVHSSREKQPVRVSLYMPVTAALVFCKVEGWL